jgi:hypothetical protein
MATWLCGSRELLAAPCYPRSTPWQANRTTGGTQGGRGSNTSLQVPQVSRCATVSFSFQLRDAVHETFRRLSETWVRLAKAETKTFY